MPDQTIREANRGTNQGTVVGGDVYFRAATVELRIHKIRYSA